MISVCCLTIYILHVHDEDKIIHTSHFVFVFKNNRVGEREMWTLDIDLNIG